MRTEDEKLEFHAGFALKRMKPKARDEELGRFAELTSRHNLQFKRVGSTYFFGDFKAHGLRQALGYAEGYDRAMRDAKPKASRQRSSLTGGNGDQPDG